MVAKDIVCMLASSSSTSGERGLGKVLGVDRQNIQKVMDKQI